MAAVPPGQMVCGMNLLRPALLFWVCILALLGAATARAQTQPLKADFSVAIDGQAVTLASTTPVPAGAKLEYAWDLDADAMHRAALVEVIEQGPIPAVHGVVRWRIIDLMQWQWDEFSVSVSKPTLSRELRALGYRKLPARPKHHAQDEAAVEAFKKGASLPSWTRSERPSRAARQ